ncbi:solute carrier family 23 protein, partial [Planococcus sp. SIMBA_143]
FALSDITKQDINETDLAKGYRSEGLALFLGGIFNAFPYTAYSHNVGLIQMSGVKSRKSIFIASILLSVLGFVPQIGAMP